VLYDRVKACEPYSSMSAIIRRALYKKYCTAPPAATAPAADSKIQN
jgi:hypothetical protein